MKPAGWALPVSGMGLMQMEVYRESRYENGLMAILLDTGGAQARQAVIID
ncbi:hypothetical protein SAMN05880561_102582 [Rhizobium sp. RU33A]|nr:hypothetical protein SAMN05880561_102582 [Rhizobium sp. RU33A]